MRYNEIIENAGIDFDMTFDDDTGSFATVTARAQGRVLGSVKFFMDGDTLEADMVEVDERYRGQGIAAAMYDYAKSQGYTVEKSDALTPDGEHFWNKNRGEQAVWEEGMAEAFDQPYKTKSEKSDYGDIDMLAKLPDGSNLSIMFNQEYGDEGEEVVQVEFYRNNSQEVTGEGDAQRIFATVLDAIQKYIKKYKPQKLSLSASKEIDMDADHVEKFNPESRAKLYDRLVQRYARAWGYQAFRADTGSIVRYELSRLKPGMAENTAAGINKMFNNLGDPVYANLQRVALLAMQGRQQEAQGRLNSVIKDASPQVQKKIIDAVNVIKPVTINGRVADSSTLDKSKAHQDWILNTFIPWVQSLLGQQSVAEGMDREFNMQLAKILKTRGYKGPVKLEQLGTKWTEAIGDIVDIDDYIMVQGNDPEYDGWVSYVFGLGKYAYGAEQGYTIGTAKRVEIDTRDEQGVAENFHDGRNPQDKGDSKRHGVPTKASISTLRKVAKQGGRKGQLAHWMANMKSGRAKKN